MNEEIRHADGRIEHPSVLHERSDAAFRWIMGIGVASVVLAALILGVVWWFFRGYGDYQARIKRSPYPLASEPSSALPAEPHLEQLNRIRGIVSSNVYQRQADKEDVLNSYGPSAEKGYIHIPIERAMSLLEGKLPARQEAAEEGKRANGLIDAGEPNSGRLFRGTPQWSER
jgi:hypothetical protein